MNGKWSPAPPGWERRMVRAMSLGWWTKKQILLDELAEWQEAQMRRRWRLLNRGPRSPVKTVPIKCPHMTYGRAPAMRAMVAVVHAAHPELTVSGLAGEIAVRFGVPGGEVALLHAVRNALGRLGLKAVLRRASGWFRWRKVKAPWRLDMDFGLDGLFAEAVCPTGGGGA